MGAVEFSIKRWLPRPPERWLLETRLAVKDTRRPTAMNPTDILILMGTWGLAGAWISTHGLTPGGIGPASLLVLGGAWHTGMQWLRHRSWQRHRDSGFAPGTQPLALLGAVGFLICVSGALVWAILVQGHR